MKQGNPQRKMGRVAILTAMIKGQLSTGNTPIQLMYERDQLLTNGGRAPIPGRMLNQRQKRKRNRQTSNFK